MRNTPVQLEFCDFLKMVSSVTMAPTVKTTLKFWRFGFEFSVTEKVYWINEMWKPKNGFSFWTEYWNYDYLWIAVFAQTSRMWRGVNLALQNTNDIMSRDFSAVFFPDQFPFESL